MACHDGSLGKACVKASVPEVMSSVSPSSSTRAGSASNVSSRSSSPDTRIGLASVANRRAEATDLTVRAARLADANAILRLYNEDYVRAHSRIYAEAADLKAPDVEWGEALGNVDFTEVLKGSKNGEEDVRLLVCVERRSGTIIGYSLCELRSKGPKKKKQFFCELVNIVVSEKYRGFGAGRLLYEAFRSDVRQAAPKHAGDVRLYVAEKNLGPLSWYRRLGFSDGGWQSETVGEAKVQFLRMIRRDP